MKGIIAVRICFIIPGFTRTPIGGHKIIYEYANRLSSRNHKVDLIFLNNNKMKQYNLPEFIRKCLVGIVTRYEPRWFKLDKKITKKSGQLISFEKYSNVYDCVFATGIQTVNVVKENFDNSKKLYLIQGYENWGVTDEYLKETYGYGFCNIVVSNWLKEIVDKYAQKPSLLLKNPIDTSIYKVMKAQNERRAHTIGLLYHTDEIKGVKYAIDAIYKLKDKYQDLTVEMFGMFQEPQNLPDWIKYKKSASQLETVNIYNKVQVFLCATIEEGYGLTGLEAMACGACLVSTAYKGVYEYAIDGYNALLSPIKDVDSLVSNVSMLFEDENKRMKLAQNGVNSVKSFSWENALDKLEMFMN